MISNNNVGAWSYQLTPTPREVNQFRQIIKEETRYYNAVVSGLAGPIRSIGDTIIKLTGHWEEMFGLAAALSVNPLRDETAHASFAKYAPLIESADERTKLVFDVVTAPAYLAALVRRAIAIEALRAARDQVTAMRATVNSDTQVYRNLVTTLTPYEPGQKRHIQIPVKACTINDAQDGKIAIKIPYLRDPITVSAPPVSWNLMIIKDDDTRWTMTLLREKSMYLMGRADAPGLRKRRKKAQRRTSEKA